MTFGALSWRSILIMLEISVRFIFVAPFQGSSL